MKLHPMLIPIGVTLIWFGVASIFAISSDWSNIQPNEIGDFLSGVAAPAAFFWLILGYHLQRQELALQRDELKLTREEIARQARSLEQQAELLKKQVSLEEEEATYQQLTKSIALLPASMRRCIDILSSFDVLTSVNAPFTQARMLKKEDFPSDDSPHQIRKFCQQFNAAQERWNKVRSDTDGTVFACMRKRNPKRLADLQEAHKLFEGVFDRCVALADQLDSQDLGAAAVTYGAYDLLNALRSALTIRAAANMVLGKVTSGSSNGT